MTEDRWQRVQELFTQALERQPEKRASFLNEACGDDAELRAEVESLLAHDEQAKTAFLEPADSAVPVHVGGGEGLPETEDRRAENLPLRPCPSLPGYEFVRELHRGGQGVVYEALQKSTKRKVAIKILLEGRYASKSARKRFEREIDLVAQLKHPNIITVFDSGTTPDGQPFCVMDYVRGLPLHLYVREKNLALEEVLKLFAAVCEALQYAHQKGVIHRDLKPSNILVDADGHPKVLDFGLAKQLTSPVDTLVTVTRDVIGTLAYMSPEQARGNPDEIDIRTDVYALGVILYELLTGHFPYPVVGQMAEVLRNIADTTPTPPSRQWKADSGVTKRSAERVRPGECPIDDEVQTIILKALSKERERRYQGAGELARDLGHYLAGEPIEAKRDSGLYVLKKTLGRYKGAVAIVIGLVLLLTVALFITSHQYLRAEYINKQLRLVSRAFVWRELVSRHASDAEEIWPTLRSHIADRVRSEPAAFADLPELRRLVDELAAYEHPAQTDRPIRGLPLVAIQRGSEGGTFSWLSVDDVPLRVGDRFQCMIASTRPLFFRIYCKHEHGSVDRLFPGARHVQSEATILLYAPEVSSDQWWPIKGPPGRQTLLILGFEAAPGDEHDWVTQLASLDLSAQLAQNAFYPSRHGAAVPDETDPFWTRICRAIPQDTDFLAVVSFPVVSQEDGG